MATKWHCDRCAKKLPKAFCIVLHSFREDEYVHEDCLQTGDAFQAVERKAHQEGGKRIKMRKKVVRRFFITTASGIFEPDLVFRRECIRTRLEEEFCSDGGFNLEMVV